MADTMTAHKSITLNANGITFDTAFNTVVTKVVNPDENSKIVLAALSNVQISLGDQSAKSLGIEKDTKVTVKPIEGSTDGSFTLEVGEKLKPLTTPRSRGSSPVGAMKISNALR